MDRLDFKVSPMQLPYIMVSEIKTVNSSNFVDVTSRGMRSPGLQLRRSSLLMDSDWIIIFLPRTWNDWHEVNWSNFRL